MTRDTRASRSMFLARNPLRSSKRPGCPLWEIWRALQIPPATRRPRNQPLPKPPHERAVRPQRPRQSEASGCLVQKGRVPLEFVLAGMHGRTARNTVPRGSIKARFPLLQSAPRASSRLLLPKQASFYFARSPPHSLPANAQGLCSCRSACRLRPHA